LAQQFRQHGVSCEVFLDAAGTDDGKQLVKQFVLAEKKGLRWVIIPGADPSRDSLTLRDLAGRQNKEGLTLAQAVQVINGK
jgi:histidyl-tRNA synthetase